MKKRMSEKIADIVAQMRGRGEDGRMDMWLWRQYADRIEEAWKREKAEIEADALAVGGIVEAARHKPVGNAAAMRETLVQCELFLGNVSRHGHPMFCFGDQCTACNGVDELREMVIRAISAPARNCDLYASATEALKAQDVAFNEDNFKNGECKLGCPGCDDGLINCKILWLFATAKERKGEGDEQK